jgi:branched-chain amino acid transport system ATP-binding protein
MLELSGIVVSYGMIEALKGISLRVEQGEIVALIGANGAGKSTTLMSISGSSLLQQGSIAYNGIPIAGRPAHEIVRMGVSQVPEGRRIFSRMTVTENLEMGAFVRNKRETAGDMERCFEMFPALAGRRGQLGGTLSGGEQQMLAIGRALMAKPKLLLLDEPSLGLAPIMVSRIFKIIKEINQQGTTVLLVEQNAKAALRLAHRAYVMETGKIVMEGPASVLENDPGIKKAYLGE